MKAFQPPITLIALSAVLAIGQADLRGIPPEAGGVAATANDFSILQPGDRLSFQIVEDGDPPIQIEVNTEGLINLPYLGEVSARGLTERSLSALIKSKLDKDFYKSATLRLALIDRAARTSNRGRIFLSGQVRHIGLVEIDKNENNTAGKVILEDGGLSDFADARKIKIFRTDPSGAVKSQIVDLHEVLDKGRLDLDVPLFDGDFVVVGSKLVNW